jgi:hypothetical protein
MVRRTGPNVCLSQIFIDNEDSGKVHLGLTAATDNNSNVL